MLKSVLRSISLIYFLVNVFLKVFIVFSSTNFSLTLTESKKPIFNYQNFFLSKNYKVFKNLSSKIYLRGLNVF